MSESSPTAFLERQLREVREANRVRDQALFELCGHKLSIWRDARDRWAWVHAGCFCGFRSETYPAISDEQIRAWHRQECGE